MRILVECFYFHKTKKLSERKSRCEYSCLADDWLSVMARHVVEPFKRDNFKDVCSYLYCCIVEVKRTLHTISMRVEFDLNDVTLAVECANLVYACHHHHHHHHDHDHHHAHHPHHPHHHHHLHLTPSL